MPVILRWAKREGWTARAPATEEVAPRRGLRRELLLWREVVSELYLRETPDQATHTLAQRVLLQMTPAAAKQVAPLGL